MMKTYKTKVEERTEQLITLPEELGFQEGDKFSIKQNPNGTIELSPYKEILVDLDDNVFLELAKMAHEEDITFNDLCEKLLREFLYHG